LLRRVVERDVAPEVGPEHRLDLRRIVSRQSVDQGLRRSLGRGKRLLRIRGRHGQARRAHEHDEHEIAQLRLHGR
jgi:hypothetical protein